MTNLFHVLTKENKIDIIYLIQEPYYYQSRITGLPRGFKVFGAKNSRAIIIAHERMNLAFCQEFTCDDHTTCLISMKNMSRYISSIYLDILKAAPGSQMEKMCETLSQLNANAVFGIDSNAHSTLWNADESNPRGEAMEDFIMQHNIAVLNKGCVKTFETSRCSTIIDITLAMGYYDDIDSWKVREDYWFSDHKMIQFKMTGLKPDKKRIQITDWTKFKDHLALPEQGPYDLWNRHTIERESHILETSIKTAIRKSSKMKLQRPKAAKWWNNDLYAERTEVIKKAKLWKQNKTDENFTNLIESKKAFGKSVRKAKRSSWKEFCMSAMDPKGMALLNKALQTNSSHSVGLLRKPDGSFTRRPSESINLLMNSHFPGSVPCKRVPESQNGNFCYEEAFKDSFVTAEKVRKAISTFGPRKAAGPDDIKPAALQNLDDNTINRLTKLFQAVIEIGYTPERWRNSKVIFLPKNGKDDYSNVRAFRPITLTSFLFKTLEKVVLWEIEQTVLTADPVSKHQHAFKKGYSCDSALSEFVDDIESSILRGHLALSVSLDIEGAFDNISHEAAVSAMRAKKISPTIVSWFEQYLTKRSVEIDLLGQKCSRKLIKGTPQGGILSPLIWNLTFDPMLALLNAGPVRARGFADDACLLIKGSDPETMVDLMQETLDKTVAWGERHGLTFNPQKTVTIFYHRRYKFQEPKRLRMKNVELNYSTSMKYLGVTIDHKLTWKKHVENKISNVKKQIMLIRNAIGQIWGPTPRALKWAYSGIILSSICYGSIVWSRACASETIKNKLMKLNRLMALTMMPVRPSTPTAGLEIILDIMPLDIKIQEMALKAACRVMSINQTRWDGIGKNSLGHLRWCKNKLQKMGTTSFEFDDTRTLNLSGNYKVDLESFKSGLPNSESEITAYSDGSIYQDSTGYGWLITTSDEMIAHGNGQLAKENSVFQAEIYAIQKTCERLLETDPESVTILSDSQAAIAALAGTQVKSKTVKSCIDKLNLLGKHTDITIKWVKAHANHTGNEFADALAKSGTTNSQNRTELAPPRKEAYRKITEASYDCWKHRWVSRTDCRQTKIWFPAPNRSASAHLTKLGRQDLGLVAQFVTGHNWLRRHDSIVNPNADPLCRLCQEAEESAFHIIGECPALWRSRREIFKTDLLDEKPEWKVTQLTRFINSDGVRTLTARPPLPRRP